MRIVVDGVIYETQSHGGVSRVFNEILPRLGNLEPGLNISILSPNVVKQALPNHPVIKRASLKDIDTSGIWHSTYYTQPRSWKGPKVVTVHDMTYEYMEREFNRPSDELFRKQKAQCVRDADAVICVSETTRKRVQEIYRIRPERLWVIPHGVSQSFRLLDTSTSSADDPFKTPFFLYVGGRSKRYKNFMTLIDAYHKWSGNQDVALLVAGKPWTKNEKKKIEHLNLTHLHLLNDVQDEALCRLYNQAQALIHPSLDEGFGIPLIEAMTCGCPIIASRIPATLEVAGDCPIYFNPNRSDELIQAMDQVIQEGRSSERVKRGFARKEAFGWEKSALQTLDVYQKLWGERKYRVLYVFRNNRTKRHELYQSGQGSDEFLFGLPHLDRNFFDVNEVKKKKLKVKALKYLCRPVENWVERMTGIRFRLFDTLGYLPSLQKSDVIVATIDPRGLPIAFLKLWGWVKTPLIYISYGLSDGAETLSSKGFSSRFLKWMIQCALKKTECILTLGEGDKRNLMEKFDLGPDKVFCIPFGVDTRFWNADLEQAGEYILSVGSDKGRDFETLFQAVNGDKLKMVTMQDLSNQNLGSNIEITSEHSQERLRELYQKSAFVVTPLRDVSQPSGQSSTLQAMACGKAVVLTQTKGLWDPEHLRHLDNCYLVKPHDVQGMRQAIDYLKKNPQEARRIGGNARLTAERFSDSLQFAGALEKKIHRLLQK
jgi:glycosyltransferase involved in cell wall biosynthesis